MIDFENILIEYYNIINKKFTKETDFIIKKVFAIHAHFTVKDLIKKIKDNKIKKILILEVLDDLIAAGLIRKIYIHDKEQYEQVFCHAHHDHIICCVCGKIIPFINNKIEKEQNIIAKNEGFKLLKHSLTLTGICPECLNKRKNIEEYEFQNENKGFNNKRIIPLSTITPGENVKIINIKGGKHFLHRLICMGLNIGDEIEILSNDFHGPFLIKVRNTRLGIGHGMAHKIFVEKIK